jgi:serine phosphatase RsbU (regulator of sigma subunit)
VTDHAVTRLSGPWGIVAQSVAVALVGYIVAGTAEMGLIRAFSPSERELAWVSDVLLSAALGVAVYLWRHLSVTRRALLDRERSELVLTTQLAIAADLQRRLLPALPVDGNGAQWAAALRSAGMIGGDFYDVVRYPGGQSLVLAADVSGKGIPAAMALSTLRAVFRALAKPPHGPASVMTSLGSALFEQWRGTPYVTGIVALIDVPAGRITYANAAHPAGLVVGRDGTGTLESLGPPAALLPETIYDERSLPMRPGDVCVLVSDGVTEAMGDDACAMVEAIARHVDAGPGRARAVCDAVMAAAVAGPGPDGVAEWDDDRTVVVMALLEAGTAAPGAPGRALTMEGVP